MQEGADKLSFILKLISVYGPTMLKQGNIETLYNLQQSSIQNFLLIMVVKKSKTLMVIYTKE